MTIPAPSISPRSPPTRTPPPPVGETMVVEVSFIPSPEEMAAASLIIITDTRHGSMANSHIKVVGVAQLSAICVRCRHYHGEAKCDAFPKKVPSEIMLGYVSHVHPYNGDQGIQFEPVGPGEKKRKAKKKKRSQIIKQQISVARLTFFIQSHRYPDIWQA